MKCLRFNLGSIRPGRLASVIYSWPSQWKLHFSPLNLRVIINLKFMVCPQNLIRTYQLHKIICFNCQTWVSFFYALWCWLLRNFSDFVFHSGIYFTISALSKWKLIKISISHAYEKGKKLIFFLFLYVNKWENTVYVRSRLTISIFQEHQRRLSQKLTPLRIYLYKGRTGKTSRRILAWMHEIF